MRAHTGASSGLAGTGPAKGLLTESDQKYFVRGPAEFILSRGVLSGISIKVVTGHIYLGGFIGGSES